MDWRDVRYGISDYEQQDKSLKMIGGRNIVYAIANVIGLAIVLYVVLEIFVFLGRLGAHFVVQ